MLSAYSVFCLCLLYSTKNNNTLPFRVVNVNTEIAKGLDLRRKPVIVSLLTATLTQRGGHGMASVNKVILVGNLGADPRCATRPVAKQSHIQRRNQRAVDREGR